MWEKSHLKLISDGSALGTQIIDLKTDEPIEMVEEVTVEFNINARDVGRMTMRVACPRIVVYGFFTATRLMTDTEEYEVRYIKKELNLPEDDQHGRTWMHLPENRDSQD